MNTPTPDHIGDVVNCLLRDKRYDPIFTNYDIMEISTTFSAPFLYSSLTSEAKIIHPRIYFGINTRDIYNQYYLYSITFTYSSSII